MKLKIRVTVRTGSGNSTKSEVEVEASAAQVRQVLKVLGIESPDEVEVSVQGQVLLPDDFVADVDEVVIRRFTPAKLVSA